MMYSDLYPSIEPYQKGFLDVGDGHQIYWEVSGNPNGKPIVFLHGGPGAGTQALFRRFFDPQKWRIILFDQRGCGQSKPLNSIYCNTTPHLIADLEQLRVHLEISTWHLFGGSWGSTLALAYGQAHPDRVLGFILRGVFLFRASEVEWFLNGMGHFFPEAWRRFSLHLPEAERGTLLASYYRRLTDPDPSIHLPAAHAWYTYEDSCARLVPHTPAQAATDGFALSIARMECHYMIHEGFMAPNQLLTQLPRIAHLPCIIVQGRYDIICPPGSAAILAQNWPRSQLSMIPEAGHSAMENGTRQTLVSACDQAFDL